MGLVQPRLETPLWSIQERTTSNADKYLGMVEICWGLGDQDDPLNKVAQPIKRL